jgi:hypothetical protein
MSELAQVVPAEAATQTPSGDGAALISMIERMACHPDADIEKFERLVAMKERIDQQSAQRAFNLAISGAKRRDWRHLQKPTGRLLNREGSDEL